MVNVSEKAFYIGFHNLIISSFTQLLT
jgi:hypothetical protein